MRTLLLPSVTWLRARTLLTSLALTALAFTGCASAPSGADTPPVGNPAPADAARQPAGPPPLVVASDLDNIPFAWVDEHGQPRGRDVKMMETLGQLLRRPITWKRMDFAALLPAVQAGEVDVVCATLGITAERAQLVDFSRPYFVTSLAVVTRAAPDAPATLAQLAGRNVAAGEGTTSERAVRQLLPAAHGLFANKTGAGAAARLASGEIDAVVMDGPAADALVATDPEHLRRLPEGLGEERYALVVRKGNSALRSALDDALLQIDKAGILARLNGTFGLADAGAAVGADAGRH